ncbi:hypothetical protein DICPUDRAFT_29588 [Dictyostelium purpureum]|uniref:ABC transporter domain-containing protein n=1 Tax=Dictyostelium purpureum TaxID=5786 RepID=F0ZDY6_DICPU|nr:uncharacterized protein DICPUDRAFT_29588 [Dictyostelium purpureum]EGC37880.1 hypothetical protein DICPUDRAFT_29588 [Dictyostelium purpureum]|eukprot:XP_003285630.1 hypothetical protein DICPUDRAFT_29588 [Dictyostelium purpureum]
MVKEYSTQLKTLLKKNYLLKKKSKCGIICEIIFPIVIVGVIFAILGLVTAFKPNYDPYDATGVLSNRVSNQSVLLYGSAEGSLTAEQEGVINALKEQVQTDRQLTSDVVDTFFLEINNKDDMEVYFANNSKTIYGAVWFNTSATPGGTVPFQYNIRLDSEDVNDNEEITDKSGDSEVYFKENWASIQVAVDQAIYNYYGLKKTLKVSGQRYPDPYVEGWQKWIDGRNSILKDAGSVFVTAAFFIFGFRLITDLVIEKETKIREGMKMMGLNDMAYFSSWMITILVTSLPVAIIIVIIFKASNVIYTTSFAIVFFTFIIYLLTLLSLSFIFAIFFDKSKFSGLVSIIIVVVINIFGIFVAKGNFNTSIKLFLSLFSPIAFACSFYTSVVRDIPADVLTVNWDYIVSEKDIIGMLILDLFLYLFLIWYLQEVVPTEYGTKRPWYFIFTVSYWRGIGKKSGNGFGDDIESSLVSSNEDVEMVPADLKTKNTVSLKSLRKEFHTGDGLRVAVNDLCLDMYENQIHAFLGPNGSGKSTTIGMLTGLITPTAGTAYIQGNDITTSMSKVRRTLGVCLQQDIIWSQLSVLEHLKIYASLKGVSSNNIEREAEKMAIEVDLGEKLHTPAGSLSGGQKRKLCLGIAFIGRSEVVFLDECTSGMDPLSRRGVWDFLLKYKKGRTIILTTHFMDEADFLGDRIAIISFGKLRCDGSSLYLKNKFGCGYLLTCSKNISTLDDFNTDQVTQFVQSYIPEANILSNAGTELSYRLPTSSLPKFGQFFKDFDNEIDNGSFGISTYGISVTTMEEVFLKIGQESSGGNGSNIYKNETQESEMLKARIATSSNGVTTGQQLKGLLIKRIRTSIKDLKSFFLTIVIPLACIIGSIIIFSVMDDAQVFYNDVLTPLTMSLSQYGPNNVVPVQDVSQVDFDTLSSSSFFSQFKYINQSVDFEDYLVHNYLDSTGAINVTTQLAQDDVVAYNAFYNKKALHSAPIHINLIDSALLKEFNNIEIQVTSMPFKHVLSFFDLSAEGLNISSILYFNIIMMAGLALMVASFAGNIAQERTNRIKRLLYISGCKKYVYWLSNLIWDYIFAFVVVLITAIVLAIIKEEFRQQFGLFFLGIILYCVSTIPLAYLLSYRFTTHGKATGAIAAIVFAMGIVFLIISLNIRIQVLVENEDLDKSKTFQTVGDAIDVIFSILSPLFAYSKILLLVSKFPIMRVGQYKVDNYWAIHYGGTPIIILFVHCIVWITWIMLLDYTPEIRGYFKNPKDISSPQPPTDEDSDVHDERTRIHSVEEVVKVDSLHKLFKGKGKNQDKIAVHNTCLGIPRGQTFGLLGLNGAGKTTTLSMLCGDIMPTSGQVTINGFDLVSERSQALKNISMCPQFDALVGLLSAREQLYLYCRIKGIEESKIKDVVEAFISMMDMGRIANSNCGGYSGGNKRKLSLSIAMLGDPQVVYLDEASTGCDAVVRRYIWNVVTELSKGRSIIITTHSMEECQALCSRITIMKDGKFTCLGSIQHVKNKFGAGYSFDVKFKRESFDNGVQRVLQSFPHAKLLDQHDLIASFEVSNDSSNPVKVSQLFNILQHDLGSILDDYSVSQTSLEQVFLKLTGAGYTDRLNNLDQIRHD